MLSFLCKTILLIIFTYGWLLTINLFLLFLQFLKGVPPYFTILLGDVMEMLNWNAHPTMDL